MKSARGASAKPRSALLWTRDEVLRLLRAWRDVLLQPSSSSSGPPLAVSDFDTRVFERFVELSRGAAHAPERQGTSAAKKGRALLRTFHHAVEYNKQQQDEEAERKHSSHYGKRKKRAEKQQQRRRNYWLALTAEQQQESLLSQFPRGTFAEINQEMFTILAVIDKKEMKRKERNLVNRGGNVPWTKGEVWVLISAWRRVIESRPKVRNRNSSINVMVHEQFVALSQEGMPSRGKDSIRNKLTLLVRLYRLIAEFNTQRCSSSNGPHEVDTPDWFSSSSDVQGEYIASRCDRQYKLTELDQDMFNAMELIVKYEGSLQSGTSSGRVNENASQSIIEISCDTESEDDEHDGSSDWEMMPVTSPVANEPHSADMGFADTTSNYSRRSLQPIYEPDEDRATARTSQHRQQPQAAVLATRHQPAASSVRAAASSDSEDEASSRSRKRGKANTEELTASETESFLELLSKLKKERKADKLKRRRERAERKELMELISQEREVRLRDREERQKERAQWELERDKLKFKLKKMRERYKKAAAKLKSTSSAT
ncbi:hypothetical protein Gpo141_00002879 [Globisporangium polare]